MNLARLLQLASPTLPVGAYSYSQGLEAAVEAGVVSDAASAEGWIEDVLDFSVARMEAPVLWRLIQAAEDLDAVKTWNATFLASRETAELRAETVQMGYSLSKLLDEMGYGEIGVEEPAFPTVYAFAVFRWKIPPRAALQAYLWAWLENQVMAALKVVPLGQTAGQRMLVKLGDRLAEIANRACAAGDEDLCNFAPGLAAFSSRHETQYSRLFRS